MTVAFAVLVCFPCCPPWSISYFSSCSLLSLSKIDAPPPPELSKLNREKRFSRSGVTRPGRREISVKLLKGSAIIAELIAEFIAEFIAAEETEAEEVGGGNPNGHSGRDARSALLRADAMNEAMLVGGVSDDPIASISMYRWWSFGGGKGECAVGKREAPAKGEGEGTGGMTLLLALYPGCRLLLAAVGFPSCDDLLDLLLEENSLAC